MPVCQSSGGTGLLKPPVSPGTGVDECLVMLSGDLLEQALHLSPTHLEVRTPFACLPLYQSCLWWDYMSVYLEPGLGFVKSITYGFVKCQKVHNFGEFVLFFLVVSIFASD